MNTKQAIIDSTKVREELLGSMRIEAFDDCKGISMTFSGRCLDECIDQLIEYANNLISYLYEEGTNQISLQESLCQNLCFSVPGIEGATGICVDVAHVHYYNLGLMDAADFVIRQANS